MSNDKLSDDELNDYERRAEPCFQPDAPLIWIDVDAGDMLKLIDEVRQSREVLAQYADRNNWRGRLFIVPDELLGAGPDWGGYSLAERALASVEKEQGE